MTQPKFPWALLLMIAMFTLIAITSRGYMLVFAIIAILTTASAAVYQSIPRELDPLVEHDPDKKKKAVDFVDPWGTPEAEATEEPDDFDDPWARDPKA